MRNNKRQQELLDKLVNDSCSRVPEKDRGIHMVSMEALVWNLFKGGYKFSSEDVKFVIEAKLKSNEKEAD